MLILSRKQNEHFNIGTDISVMVVEIRGDKVRIGVDAPKWLPVHRSEVLRAILSQGESVPAIGEIIATLQAENERLKAELKTLKEHK